MSFKVGDKVVHTGYKAHSNSVHGDAKRRGWLGRVVAVAENYLQIYWIKDKHGKALTYPTTQNYMLTNAHNYLRHAHIPCNALNEQPSKKYLVVCANGIVGNQIVALHRPTVAHPTHEAAVLEAERLSRNTGKTFYVFSATELVVPPQQPQVVKL